MTLTSSAVIMFTQMKKEVDEMVEKYGSENPPPPYQLFTIKNEPGDGNMHLVQKVFKGSFEVFRAKSPHL